MNTTIFLQGMMTGLALIVPIGAQNAFVLRQAILKNNRFATASVCVAYDCALIYLAGVGVSSLLASSPLLLKITLWGGVAFLTFYGLMSFRRAWKANASVDLDSIERPGLKASILIILGVTLLNPHAYLDAFVFIGSISAQYAPCNMDFAYGAMTASIVWFYSLSILGSALAPVFRKPIAWAVLDFLIGVVMLWIAVSLILNVDKLTCPV